MQLAVCISDEMRALMKQVIKVGILQLPSLDKTLLSRLQLYDSISNVSVLRFCFAVN